MSLEKNYNLIPQENNNYCLVSVLQAIFNKYKINLTQDEIASNLTPSKYGFKIQDSIFKDYAKLKGFDYEYYWWDSTPFNEPDTLVEDNFHKDIFIGWNNHVGLVTDFNSSVIQYIDPKDALKTIMKFYNLTKKMQGYGDGFFGLLKKLN